MKSSRLFAFLAGCVLISGAVAGFTGHAYAENGGGSSLADNIVCAVFYGLDHAGAPIPSLAANCTPASSGIGALKVVTVVSGGTAQPGDFTVHVKKGTVDVAGSPQPGTADGFVYAALPTDIYTVSETGPAAYTPSFTGNCVATGTGAATSSAPVAVSATSTCTITNTYSAPAVTTTAVSIAKTVDTATPAPTGNVTYTLTAKNDGTIAATGVSVTDTLASGLTYVSDDGAGAYSTTSGAWTIGSLAAGASKTLHIVALVGTTTGGQTITNAATVTAGNLDPASATTTAQVAIVSTAPSSGSGSSSTSGGNTGTSSGTSGSSSGSNTGGGNGPIVGSYGAASGGNGPVAGAYGPVPGGLVLGVSTSSNAVVPQCGEYLTAFIRSGEQNDPGQVRRLQSVLIGIEHANIQPNGIYDDATLQAVIAFQKKYAADILKPWGIDDPTGYVYITTRRKINELYCGGAVSFPLSAAEEHIIAGANVPASPASAPASASKPKKPVSVAPQAQAAASAASAAPSDAGTSSSASTTAVENASTTPVKSPWQKFLDIFHRD